MTNCLLKLKNEVVVYRSIFNYKYDAITTGADTICFKSRKYCWTSFFAQQKLNEAPTCSC